MAFLGSLDHSASDDTDGDGRPNSQEYTELTNPGSEVEDCILQLCQGWNLVSIWVEPEEALRSDGLRDTMGLNPIWGWTGGRYIIPATLLPKQGYWLYRAAPTPADGLEMVVQGPAVADDAVWLGYGWNLVGPVAPCPRPTDPGISCIWGWLPVSGRCEVVQPGDQLQPGQAYWIAVDDPQGCLIHTRP